MKIKTDMMEVTAEISMWLDDVLPDRTLDSTWIKLKEELKEYEDRPTDSAEAADITILLFDLFDLYGINISKAIHHKLNVNRNRNWKIEKDGTMNHSEE